MDPTGIVWEAYRTMGAIAVYGDDRGKNIASMLPEPPPGVEAALACCAA